jgi:hypothetical protein
LKRIWLPFEKTQQRFIYRLTPVAIRDAFMQVLDRPGHSAEAIK